MPLRRAADAADHSPKPRRGLRRRLGLTRSTLSDSSGDEANPIAMLEETSPRASKVAPEQPTLSPSESKRRTSASSVESSASSQEKSALSISRKGVKYGRDGAVVCCRFCEILRTGDADFIYEDDTIAVFRPLSPVVESHVLVVPRCHIRNINMLTTEHADLLKRMREVAELILLRGASAGSTVECKFAFHKPPFNSIDHVHMHAFRKGGSTFGCLGSIKYRTETWWCRSFEEVLARVATGSPATSLDTYSSRPSDFMVTSPQASYISTR